MKCVCRLCGGERLSPLLDMGRHPIAHHFVLNPSQNEYKHPVKMYFCDACGLVQLIDPVPSHMLYKKYVCLSSWKPQPHIPRLLTLIDELPNINKNSRIVEVGCNDGVFLNALRDAGFTHLFGIEPAEDAFVVAQTRGFSVVNAFFDRALADTLVSAQGQYDLLITRQVMEHIPNLQSFCDGIMRLVKPGGYVLIEVPHFDFIVEVADYSAIWEEHVNYFFQKTLHHLLAKYNIRVIREETSNFSGEALVVIGRNGDRMEFCNAMAPLEDLRSAVMAFSERWPRFRDGLLGFLKIHHNQGKKIAIYGAGCRAISLINFTGMTPFIEFVVDDQLEKQGKFIPGSRLPILPSAALEEKSIDLCLLAVNAENETKVISQHSVFEARGGEFVSLLPPSSLLPPFWKTL
ncbi:MAG: methyltransferase domain-containing protein [Elusimicrobia bacterium]|nr:methyltransferase domain-containing protein [Elusimicrobiota bacterium]